MTPEVRIVVRPYATSLALGFFSFGATGLGLFATSWLALGLANVEASQDALSGAVGLYEFGFAFAIVLLAVAAVAGKPLLAAILGVAAVRSALSGVHEWGGPAWA